MAYAVHGTQDGVGLTEDSAEPSGAVVDPAVMVNELSVRAPDDAPEVTDQPGPAPHVRDPAATEIERRTTTLERFIRFPTPGSQHRFEGSALRAQTLHQGVQVVPFASQPGSLVLELDPPPSLFLTGPGRFREANVEGGEPTLHLAVGSVAGQRPHPRVRLGQTILGRPCTFGLARERSGRPARLRIPLR